MNKIKSLSDFLNDTKKLSEVAFYRGEKEDYGVTACVATVIRDASSYEKYPNRIVSFDKKIRENALLYKTFDIEVKEYLIFITILKNLNSGLSQIKHYIGSY